MRVSSNNYTEGTPIHLRKCGTCNQVISSYLSQRDGPVVDTDWLRYHKSGEMQSLMV